MFGLDMSRLTEKPNRYSIFLKTDTVTDFGILKTEKYRLLLLVFCCKQQVNDSHHLAGGQVMEMKIPYTDQK